MTAGAALFELDCRVVGMAVCDSERYFLEKVRADLRHWQSVYGVDCDVDALTIVVNDHYIGPGYAKATPEVFETIRQLARTEGLLLDPVYSGKAFHGLLEEIRAGRLTGQRDVVFVHTGGLFGLMAQRSELTLRRPEREA